MKLQQNYGKIYNTFHHEKPTSFIQMQKSFNNIETKFKTAQVQAKMLTLQQNHKSLDNIDKKKK